jgi:hypothetical protein
MHGPGNTLALRLSRTAVSTGERNKTTLLVLYMSPVFTYPGVTFHPKLEQTHPIPCRQPSEGVSNMGVQSAQTLFSVSTGQSWSNPNSNDLNLHQVLFIVE